MSGRQQSGGRVPRDAATGGGDGARHRSTSHGAPRAEEFVIASQPAAALCARCGLPGPHATPADCIDALRDALADLEFRIDSRRSSKPCASAAHAGGRQTQIPVRPPTSTWFDKRMVLLDGERLSLADAARRLGISPNALHSRIEHRTGDPHYGCVDLREIGADRARRGGRRDRKDARTVILDGRRLCLTEAARELGISAVALHFRLVNRTGTADYRDVDVRVVGADSAKRAG